MKLATLCYIKKDGKTLMLTYNNERFINYQYIKYN